MRTVLVTGAGSGIGEAIARRLAAEGVCVAAGDVERSRAQIVAEELGGESFAVPFDVTDASAVREALHTIAALVEGLDGLVGAAGIEVNSHIGNLSAEQWSKVIATNLTGQFLCLKECLPLLRRRRGAAILVGSPAAHAAYPGATAYAASKAGLEGLVRAAAIDLAPEGVRVNTLVPGTTDTAMLRGSLQGTELDVLMRRAGEAVPLGRIATPAEVAAVASFLLSEHARYVTGACWVIDGGLLARLGTDV